MIIDTDSDQPPQISNSAESSTSPTFSPPLAPSEVSLSELEASSVGDSSEIQDGISVDSLREAALSIPDVEADETSSISSSNQAQSFQQGGRLSTGSAFNQPDPFHDGILSRLSNSGNGNETPIDWSAILGVSSQTLDAASTATSIGFSAAKLATSFGLTFAKRLTQVLVSVPAMAVDGALLGVAPGGAGTNPTDRQPTAAAIAHATVGGLFDGIAMLALGGLDVGSALTGAGLGAAGAGVEGVRRAMGSEVLRSLSAFSKLVKREWSASDLSTLPPGGLPAYSALGITRALTAWVLIQLVTRPDYERRQLRGMEELNVTLMRQSCKEELERRKKIQEEEKQNKNYTSSDQSTKEGVNVKITSETTLPHEEGELIGATIGSSHSSSSVVETPIDSSKSDPPVPLNNQEALIGLKRYSRLVLGVYGGVALAWLGALPTGENDSKDPLEEAVANADADAEAAANSHSETVVVDGEAPVIHSKANPYTNNPNTNEKIQELETPEESKISRQADEAEFIRAAKQDENSKPSAPVEVSGFSKDSSDMPGAFGSNFTSEPQVTQAEATMGETPSIAKVPTSSATIETSADSTNGEIQQPQRSNSTAYSYLDLASGKHDNDLFHKTAGLRSGTAEEGTYDEHVPPPKRDPKETARTSKPRYYVVTDHEEEKICLILRGSLTVGDIAADLTCESVKWQHAGEESASRESCKGWEKEGVVDRTQLEVGKEEEGDEKEVDLVHEGMYITAQEIGLPGRPVHRAVSRALTLNPTYSLDIAGHSLGAGVASLLALMWGSTETGRTHSKSGLPINRKIHAYCFAVPCVSNQVLSKRMKSIVTSFVVNYDLVCRLSLGSVLGVRNACAWLCYEDQQSRLNSRKEDSALEEIGDVPRSSMAPPPPFTLNRFTQQAFKHQSNQLKEEEKESFEISTLSLRKTLEANMNQVHLFPPGNVFISFLKNSFKSQDQNPSSGPEADEKYRLFRMKENGDLNEVFGQIQFVSGMLSDHMPQVYNNFVNDLSS